jgi:hypothetical protein
VPSSGSVEPAPLNVTASGSGPFVRLAPMTAVGGWFEPTAWMRRIVPPLKST